MRTDEQIIELFKEAVQEIGHGGELGDLSAKSEIAELGLDSVVTLEVIGLMEEKLDIRFTDDDLNGLKSLGDLCALIQKIAA